MSIYSLSLNDFTYVLCELGNESVTYSVKDSLTPNVCLSLNDSASGGGYERTLENACDSQLEYLLALENAYDSQLEYLLMSEKSYDSQLEYLLKSQTERGNLTEMRWEFQLPMDYC